MKDRFKFRAWLAHPEEMVTDFFVNGDRIVFDDGKGYNDREIDNDIIIMQFTGLKSSDGGCGLPVKDAYLGDVIRFYNTDGKEIKAEIIWYELEQCIGFKRLHDGFVYTQRMFNDSGYFQPSKIQFEIIGNIYENPELLK